MSVINVKMRQLSKYQWQIESPKGHVIQTGISFASPYKAEQYVIRYVSGFLNWSYDLVLMEGQEATKYESTRDPKSSRNKG